jgi:ketosteroid isomerase-like protein
LLNQLNDEIDSFISACKEAKATQDVGVKRKHQEDVVAAGTVAEQGEARRPRLLGNSLPKTANTDTHAVLVAQTHELIAAISAGDFNKYASFCAAGLSCIEPETAGQIIKGLKFHEHYFTLPAGDGPPVHKTTTLTDLQVRASGDMGFVTYNRVTQTGSMTSVAQETRIWERSSSTGEWVQVHFHKSIPA